MFVFSNAPPPRAVQAMSEDHCLNEKDPCLQLPFGDILDLSSEKEPRVLQTVQQRAAHVLGSKAGFLNGSSGCQEPQLPAVP